MTKPVASLSLDLDNKWSYLKTHGDANWEQADSYLDLVVSRFQQLLEPTKTKMTVFVVGRDADDPVNREAFQRLVKDGHEIGNHSYNHEPWLHLYSDEELEKELDDAERAIREITGRTPIGFRGPGFSFSKPLLNSLQRRGYAYDCSTFPTYLGPLARAYYFLRSGLARKERDKRKALFGSFTEGFRSIKPYRWNLTGGQLAEIPVTTMPLFRLPIHASYVLFLSRWSATLALTYFRFALLLCRTTGVQPSILLHPLDVLGCDDESELSFFPAMDLPSEKKLLVMKGLIQSMTKRFDVMPMREHVHHLQSRRLPEKAPPQPVVAAARQSP